METPPPQSPFSFLIRILLCFISLIFIFDLSSNIFFGKSIFEFIYQISNAPKDLLGTTDTSTLKFFFCMSITITICCWFVLFSIRFLRPTGVFIMPFRFWILITVASIAFHFFSLSSIPVLNYENYNSSDHLTETSRVMIYGLSEFVAWFMACGWLGFVRLAFFGSKKERNNMDLMMRAPLFMKLPHEK